jgi:acetyl/propionyl-CoA carboxylase alpha subunit/acetyl-CoA carboxylase carboxyltransferase component
MATPRVLVANRGEIAVRLLETLRSEGAEGVALYAEDDRQGPWVTLADRAEPLPGAGAGAYLDQDAVLAAAAASGATAVHPGYGFLSENATFAARCEAAGLIFLGPTPAQLRTLGAKTDARALAKALAVPLLPGTEGATSLEVALAFQAAHPGPLMLKAIAGGGGRGIRPVAEGEDLRDAFERCTQEAEKAFGEGALYLEQALLTPRHIEVQILGDGQGGVVHLWERECTLQRRRQKLLEVAPSPTLDPALRARMLEAALAMAKHLNYRSLGTFEFLVDPAAPEGFAFMEANPRLQVEHTVTEMITGLDLVACQLAIGSGASLEALGLTAPPAYRGFAAQARVNLETLDATGAVRPQGGTLTRYTPPSGPGIRVDGWGAVGLRPSPRYDSLLAKVIVHSATGSYAQTLGKLEAALGRFDLQGIQSTLPLLRALLRDPAVQENQVDTTFVERHAETLLTAAATLVPAATDAPAEAETESPAVQLDAGDVALRAPMQGTVVSWAVAPGAAVAEGALLCIMDAMKMEHEVRAPQSGILRSLHCEAGDAVLDGAVLAALTPAEVAGGAVEADVELDLDAIRPDLAEVLERHGFGFDENRPEAVARRRKTGQRTTRENLDDLVAPGSFVEYGALTIAAQRRRRPIDDLIKRTPADGMVAGHGIVNGDLFDPDRSRTVVMSYDYTVLAGTQGTMNHIKKDRLIDLAERSRLPVVFFTEGGGGRPGDTDGIGVAGLDCLAFWTFGQLSGQVPLVGITSGRCFAGNAALLGTCDVVIATENSNIGMGGPAMIEGGGLGVFPPEAVGPLSVQRKNGVVDLVAQDEAEAVALAKQYLSYFQGPVADWRCADQRTLRHLIPENRLRVYDVRRVIHTLADEGSVLELRREFGVGMITCLARIEGKPVGLIANDPTHLSGAIDAVGCDKSARFMQLCDAFNLPIVSLCDTPGFMVGPAEEENAMVRHAGRLFVVAGSLTVPLMTLVLRKGYGLGAQAMTGGSFRAPYFIVGWPTSEFGGMGLEGAVKLGYRKELEAIEDLEEREKTYQQMVDRMYQRGKGTNMASHFEIDDVIDPAESRRWISAGLEANPLPHWRTIPPKRPCVDTW